jgi:hypothetical protein
MLCAAACGSLLHPEPRGSKGGDAMAGGNFDDNLTIDNGRIKPTGSLGDLVVTIENRLHFHFWVIQMKGGRTGAFMQASGDKHPTDSTKWMARLDGSVHRHGEFEQGQAVGIGLAILDSGDMDWWSETIRLQPATAA